MILHIWMCISKDGSHLKKLCNKMPIWRPLIFYGRKLGDLLFFRWRWEIILPLSTKQRWEDLSRSRDLMCSSVHRRQSICWNFIDGQMQICNSYYFSSSPRGIPSWIFSYIGICFGGRVKLITRIDQHLPLGLKPLPCHIGGWCESRPLGYTAHSPM
jgi:hypothetical protein